MKFLATYIIAVILVAKVSAQNDTVNHKSDSLPGRFYILQKVKREGETLPEIEIKEVNINGHRSFAEKFQVWRYERLVNNVKRVYPYSLIVKVKLIEVNEELASLPNDRERRKYINEFEKQVFKEYEDDIRDMTITQGRILIKLIDRETQNTSYELIREYRGKISAVFWQGIARIFGTNLKEKYDPVEEDALIERIVLEIEAGRL